MGVSGEKHVCPATFFNQLHQCLTPRIARVHLDAGALRERGIDFVKRVLHGGSGKDGNTFFLARCEVSPEECEKCENNRGESDNLAHSVLPKRFTTRMSACSALTPKWQRYPSYPSEDPRRNHQAANLGRPHPSWRLPIVNFERAGIDVAQYEVGRAGCVDRSYASPVPP